MILLTCSLCDRNLVTEHYVYIPVHTKTWHTFQSTFLEPKQYETVNLVTLVSQNALVVRCLVKRNLVRSHR